MSHAIKILTRGAYDLQKLRISTGNRIAMNFRARLGQAPGEREEDSMSAEDIALIADLKQRYARITDAIAKHPRAKTFPGDEVISSYADLAMVGEYVHMEELERS